MELCQHFSISLQCGRFISPIIGELSEQYPHVTTYKVDIDEKGLTNTLDELNISSVPTFQFFKDGKTVAEVVGANVAHLRNTLKNASSNSLVHYTTLVRFLICERGVYIKCIIAFNGSSFSKCDQFYSSILY
ncbi:thioredoxin O1, mitochondrial-like isoform X1 [Malus domestica]|uniref:thioredoxin O1, mitochondrial-like isoform X1 n=1 Tax=Malus domestica TaxID=3750 RepID=UPI003975A979